MGLWSRSVGVGLIYIISLGYMSGLAYDQWASRLECGV